MQIVIDAAQGQLAELVEAATAGADVVLAIGGLPVAKIVALEKPQRRPFKIGLLEGILPPPPDDFFDPLGEDELALWEGEV